MKTYTVKTGPADKQWWIEIPEVDMGFSQAENFGQVESMHGMAREVISLLLGVPEDSFGVEIVVQSADQALDDLAGYFGHLDDEQQRALTEVRDNGWC